MVLKYSKRIPYIDTTVTPEKSRGDVERVLYAHGASAVNIVTQADGQAILRFVMDLARENTTKRIVVEITPPHISQKVKVWDEKLSRRVDRDVINTAAAWRVCFHFVKAKLDAVTTGLVEFEHEFLADTVIKDDQGREVTVAKILIPLLERTGGQLSLPPASESVEERRRVVV